MQKILETARPWADPKNKGNKLRLEVKCIRCGKLGCITAWGPWCYECNVKRMDRIDSRFNILREILDG
jgi:hypothetical protein